MSASTDLASAPGSGAPVIADVFRRLSSSSSFRAHMAMVSERADAFGSELRMKLAALGMDPVYRAVFDEAIDNHWARAFTLPYSSSTSPLTEVVVGAGLHASIYASARVATGYPAPLVLEASSSAGGAFAISRKPSFRLNSDNAPGITGLPKRRAALNYLPGAPVQPADLSGDEFQTNAELAYCIRVALALNATVATARNVRSMDAYVAPARLSTGMAGVYARRIIDARGLGQPQADSVPPFGTNIISADRFMASMDQPWPLRGTDRWAVLGGGDSGKCVIEALLGIGPTTFPATVDYIRRRIDWYANDLQATRSAWRDGQRGRYSRIGSYLVRDDRVSRVRVLSQPGNIVPAGSMVLVNGRPYDKVVLATGYRLTDMTAGPYSADFAAVRLNGLTVASQVGSVYRIGPAARIDYSSDELADGINIVRAGSNKDAIFRLAYRTAAFANSFKT